MPGVESLRRRLGGRVYTTNTMILQGYFLKAGEGMSGISVPKNLIFSVIKDNMLK